MFGILLDSTASARQFMSEGEFLTKEMYRIPYTAGCPECGNDATFEDVLSNVAGAGTQRTVVQHFIDCKFCDNGESS